MKTIQYSIQHLRFHFSVFLLPVFLFAMSRAADPFHWKTAILFVLLHLLVYPSSNAYNSIQDRDTGSIGGLKHPPPIPTTLSGVTIFLDSLALVSSAWFFGLEVFLLLGSYILASRAYSYRGIRIKRFPLGGFALVASLQGGLIYFITSMVASQQSFFELGTDTFLGALAATVMIGAGYPITQIYQHEQDRLDGVNTLSMRLGEKGTLLFSASLFALFTAFIFLLRWETSFVGLLFLLVTTPTVFFFLYWMRLISRDLRAANYDNTMRMNVISTITLNVFFTTLLIIQKWSQ
ncbi:MAG: UbiA prenyltransferase family protein [Lunatimonas sp.]|uniref:UbiA family prenyltransferase n=1 Tax=Lunatimonas sp. TaxID=2060141 RepID=UPI00263A8821|nr:UbiA family prenyltransferase [Lunatimonas sp.]MCC5939234.1 UbiA prenyltransferase family protein [Lunatimonas sp.]